MNKTVVLLIMAMIFVVGVVHARFVYINQDRSAWEDCDHVCSELACTQFYRNCVDTDQGDTTTCYCRARVYDSILDCVGNTPLVKLNTIPKLNGLLCDIYVKCEYLNPAGSIKDRVAVAMCRDAKAVDAIKVNTKLVEATSGNTGIGIAFVSAIWGKKCTIVMGENNSAEKVDTMNVMGTEVLKVKGGTSPIARQIKDNDPDNVVILNQFANHVNPQIHYETTGKEIVTAMGNIDMVVMGAGTGGTISGVGARVKQEFPSCVVVGAEPDGAKMMNPRGRIHPYLVEGVGGSGHEIVLDRGVIDYVETITDQEAFLMARKLASSEGILCGGSAGMAVAGAVSAAKKLNLGAGKRVVVILPDGIRNYMTKFVSDQWMEAHLFMDPPERSMKWWKQPITNLVVNHAYPKLNQNLSCEQALDLMKDTDIAVIIDDQERFVGVITKNSIRHFATNPLKLPNENNEVFDFKDSVKKHLAKDVFTLAENGTKGMPTIGLLSRILDITPFVIIGEQKHDREAGADYFIPKGVITGDDVLDYIYLHRND